MEASLGRLRNRQKLNEKESKFRVATFITCIGPDALEVHKGLPFRSDEKKKNIT